MYPIHKVCLSSNGVVPGNGYQFSCCCIRDMNIRSDNNGTCVCWWDGNCNPLTITEISVESIHVQYLKLFLSPSYSLATSDIINVHQVQLGHTSIFYFIAFMYRKGCSCHVVLKAPILGLNLSWHSIAFIVEGKSFKAMAMMMVNLMMALGILVINFDLNLGLIQPEVFRDRCPFSYIFSQKSFEIYPQQKMSSDQQQKRECHVSQTLWTHFLTPFSPKNVPLVLLWSNTWRVKDNCSFWYP